MGHKSFAIAFVLGLLALPLACGSDDDNPGGGTGGAGGSSGKTGTGGANKGGTANGGSAGKDGTAGKGGTPGGAGEGGTGDTGNVGGGGPEAGAGGDTGPSGAGAGGMGAGGEAGGGATDPAAARLAQCKAICNYPAQPDGPGGTKPRMQCLGDANTCAAALCETTDWNAACVKTLDDLLACLPTADPSLFYCDGYVDADTLAGVIAVDFAADGTCSSTFAAWTACINSH